MKEKTKTYKGSKFWVPSGVAAPFLECKGITDLASGSTVMEIDEENMAEFAVGLSAPVILFERLKTKDDDDVVMSKRQDGRLAFNLVAVSNAEIKTLEVVETAQIQSLEVTGTINDLRVTNLSITQIRNLASGSTAMELNNENMAEFAVGLSAPVISFERLKIKDDDDEVMSKREDGRLAFNLIAVSNAEIKILEVVESAKVKTLEVEDKVQELHVGTCNFEKLTYGSTDNIILHNDNGRMAFPGLTSITNARIKALEVEDRVQELHVGTCNFERLTIPDVLNGSLEFIGQREDGRWAFQQWLAISNVEVKTLYVRSIEKIGGGTLETISADSFSCDGCFLQFDRIHNGTSIGNYEAQESLRGMNTLITVGGRHKGLENCTFLGSVVGLQPPQSPVLEPQHATGIGVFAFHYHTGSIDYCTAVGSSTGKMATAIERSCCFGYESGSEANSTDSIYIGYKAGRKVTGNNNIFIHTGGDEALEVSNSLRIGSLIEGHMSNNLEQSQIIFACERMRVGSFEFLAASSANNMSIVDPTTAGSADVSGTATNSVCMGAGTRIDNVTQSVLLGTRTGTNIRNNYGIGPLELKSTVAIGYESGRTRFDASHSVFIGDSAGSNAQSASSSVMIGSQAGAGSHGIHNIFLGHQSGKTFHGSYCVGIGRDQHFSSSYSNINTEYRLSVGMFSAHPLIEGTMQETDEESELKVNASNIFLTDHAKISPTEGALGLCVFHDGAWVEGAKVDAVGLSTPTLKLSNVIVSEDGAELGSGVVYKNAAGFLKIA